MSDGHRSGKSTDKSIFYFIYYYYYYYYYAAFSAPHVGHKMTNRWH